MQSEEEKGAEKVSFKASPSGKLPLTGTRLSKSHFN